VYRALEKNPVPPALPIDMIPLSKRRNVHGVIPASILPGAVPVLPGALGQMPQAGMHGALHPAGVASPLLNPVTAKWVVTPVEKAKYDELFRQTDTDMDGLVNGLEIKDILLQTGLPQPTLAHIWLVVHI